jgi:hypothetical protein
VNHQPQQGNDDTARPAANDAKPHSRRLRASAPLAVLVLLAAGRTVAQTADVTTWSRRRVVELARHIGWDYDTDADKIRPAVRPAVQPVVAVVS